MRALLPEANDDVDLHSWYAQDWLDPGGLRVNFVSSVDGAATADGLSRGLQTPGDNTVFAALRDLSDVLLVGSGTVLAEGYAASRPGARRRAIRRAHGLREVLPTAVVTRSLRLDPAAALFTEAVEGARTIVLTCDSADPAARTRLARVSDVISCGDDRVELDAVRTALEQRGLTRILCEGGPSLFGELVEEGVADELCLSITPLLTGPGAPRIVGDLPREVGPPRHLVLTGLLEEDGALFCRYRLPRT